MTKVSVIVPVYNAEAYISRCVDSIVNQTYKDVEIIIVDDGSTDASTQICNDYANIDSRIRCIIQDNMGPDIARKTGVEEAAGEYLFFVDADDYISENAIEIMLNEALVNNSDLVCSQVIRFDVNGHTWSDYNPVTTKKIYSNLKEIMWAYFAEKILLGTYYAKLIRKELLVDYNFVENSIIGEDISAALYMFQNAKKIVILPEQTYFYFWNENSISHMGYTDRHLVSLKNYIVVREQIIKINAIAKDIVYGYFAGFEMAVATAMSRNRIYNNDSIKLLRDDLKSHIKYIISDKKTRIYMKICVCMYCISPKAFMVFYRFASSLLEKMNRKI